MAVEARNQSENNVELGFLLAYEALTYSDNSNSNTALREFLARMPWQGTPLFGHTDRVNSAVFSPDGSRILTASSDNTARLWRSDGTFITTLSGHTDKLTSPNFSPDGTQILTALYWTP